MNVAFHRLNVGEVTALKEVETGKVLGTVIGHCGGWNYEARYVDPETTLLVTETFEVEGHAVGRIEGSAKMTDDEYDAARDKIQDEIVYESYLTGERDIEALESAKKFLFKKCSEIYGELTLVEEKAA